LGTYYRCHVHGNMIIQVPGERSCLIKEVNSYVLRRGAGKFGQGRVSPAIADKYTRAAFGIFSDLQVPDEQIIWVRSGMPHFQHLQGLYPAYQ
jgi:hypothetical protein